VQGGEAIDAHPLWRATLDGKSSRTISELSAGPAQFPRELHNEAAKRLGPLSRPVRVSMSCTAMRVGSGGRI
jgi:hypothetical protein